MKKTLVIVILGLAITYLAFGADSTPLAATQATGPLKKISWTTPALSGYVEAIDILISGSSGSAKTNTLSIVTSIGQEIIYTNTISATTILRPRMQTSGNTGAALTNGLDRVLLVEEKLIITLYEAGPTTNTYTGRVVIDNK